MTDAPEYHTKPLSPLSPLPVHPPEPSNIPVLRNQIDPIFNMTSTHIEVPHPTVAALAESNSDPIASTFLADGDSPADSSFSDAYKEEMDGMEHAEAKKDSEIPQQTVTDDYAMTFDSDGEEHSDSQDMSHENIEQDSEALPVSLSLSEIPYSSISRDIPATDTQIGQDTEPTTTSSPPIYPPTVDAAAPSPSESASSQLRVETSRPHTHTYEAIANGEIDIQQLLDNITANAEKNEAASAAGTPTSAIPSSASLPKAGSSLPTHSSLPPRPQVPRSNYTDDISKYHAGAQAVNTYRPPPGVNVPLNAAAAPGTYTDRRNGLPPPPSASFRQPSIPLGSPISPSVHPSASHFPGQDQPMRPGSADDINDADVRWGPDVQKKYDNFLIEERMYVTEGQWDRFPNGSRLFIGNLPSDKVTKRDIFHVFHKYGRLAQVAIKQAYGFVQFHETNACHAALRAEQGSEVRGRRMHLEISKPQKNTRNAQNAQSAAPVRRSRSPDYNRGGIAGRQGQSGRGHDRYDGRSAQAIRDEYGRILRVRDDYRPARSPSPVRNSFRSRDSYGPNREVDSYDGRERRRSRSPYGQRDDRYRERPLSPRRREADEDAELEIPRRDPQNVPDVQLILVDQLDRNFVSWVENEIRARNLKVEVMFLSPRLPVQAVIRRQILEGVHAVSQLDLRSQNSSKIPLQVFDRQGGANNVRFDEYQDLDPKIAAELVLRTKSNSAPVLVPAQTAYPGYVSGQAYQPPVPQPSYQQALPQQAYQPPPLQPTYQQPPSLPVYQQTSSQQAYQQPLAQAAPNLANLVGQLDNDTLQKLLGSLSATPQQNIPAVTANAGIDLAGLLGGLKPQPPQQNYAPAPDPYYNAAANQYGNGAPQQAQVPQQSAQQVQNIMAQLAKFRQ